jgi:HEAT repeat protein
VTCLLLLALLPAQAGPEELVRRLGSDVAAEREAAAADLILLGEPASAALERAARGGDADLAGRAAEILGRIALLRGVTPALERALPGVRKRLARAELRTFTEVFLEATAQSGSVRRHPELGREDFLGLAAPALEGAQGTPQTAAVLRAVGAWRLESAKAPMARLLPNEDWGIRQPLQEAVLACRLRELAPEILRLHLAERDRSSYWTGLLVRLGCRELIPHLEGALLSPGRHGAHGVADALAELDAVEALPALHRALLDGREAGDVVRALRRIAPEELAPALLEALEDERPDVRRRALDALTRQVRPVALVPALRKELAHSDSDRRADAAARLGRLRRAEAAGDLLKLLEDESPSVRRAAAAALARLGRSEGLSELIPLFRHPEQRLWAVNAAAELGARALIPDLLRSLELPDPPEATFSNRARILEVLASWDVPESRPAIEELLKHEKPYWRRSAAWCLAQLDGVRALPRLRGLLEDPDLNVAWGSFWFMTRLLPPDAVLDDVRAWTRNENPWSRRQAVGALARLRPDEGVPLLRKQLESADALDRSDAAQTLARLRVADAAPALRVLRTDPEAGVRREAAAALLRLGDRSALADLLRADLWGRDFAAFNAIRRPELWRAWSERRLSGPPLKGGSDARLDELARRAGLAVERPAGILEDPDDGDESAVDGLDLLSAVFETLSWEDIPVFDEGRIRLLPVREGRRFWLRWAAEEIGKSDPAEAARIVEALDASERRLRERSAARPAATPEEVDAQLTPALRAREGLARRLARGGDEAWTREFLELLKPRRDDSGIRAANADLDALVARALAGARAPHELQTVLGAVAERGLGRARPGLEGRLAHPVPEVRLAAARALLRLDGAAASTALAPLLGDPAAEVRKGAVELLAPSATGAVRKEILARLDDPAIVAGIAGSAGDLEEAVPALLRFARSDASYMTRYLALLKLGYLGGPALGPSLREQLRIEKDPQCLLQICTNLGAWGIREATPELIEVLARPRALPGHYGPAAVEALAQLGAREAVPTLRSLLPDRDFALSAAHALARLGAVEALPDLRKLLDSPRPGIAAVPLARLGDRESLPGLRALLESPRLHDYAPAAQALALLGDRASYPAILGKPADGNLSHALALIRTPEAIERLLRSRAWQDPDHVPLLASPALLPLLREQLAAEHAYTRRQAVRVVGLIPGEEALAELRRLLGDEDEQVRLAAAERLCRRGVADGARLVLEQASKPGYRLPFALNALRSPEGWRKLREARIRPPFAGTARELAALAAKEAGLRLVDLPDASPETPAWRNVHLRLDAAEAPLSGIEALDRLSMFRWGILLDGDDMKVLGRADALRAWEQGR